MEAVPIAKFKATCLALLEKVRRTGQPILVTRRGEPIAEVVPCSARSAGRAWLGSFAATGRIVGDIVSPASDVHDWEALGPGREASS
jgi:prevent-host-death family protein